MIVPRATYRLQLNRGFTFEQAARVVPYLAALGVSHVYASPFLKARPGSTHGYDITDHGALNPDIGTEEDFRQLIAALRSHGMGLLADVVPNHMGVMGADNAWWLDVLENGPASAHAGYFDIEWQPASEALRGKVLLPVLGGPYGAVLEDGQLQLAFDAAAGELAVRYHDHRFPIDPCDYGRVLRTADPVPREIEALAAAFERLPPRGETAPDRQAERRQYKETLKRELARQCAGSQALAAHVQSCVDRHAGPFDRLHELMERQAWRLAHWRVAADDINYRRFFDVHDLAALRMESEAVFEDTHRLLMKWVHEGAVDALRIDHPDGLYDPGKYLERLQRAGGGGAGGERPLYVVVEKILAQHERLPESWPVQGTTGYRFMNVVNGLFVDGRSESAFDRIYAAFIGARPDYEGLVHGCKVLIMTNVLSSEMNRLSNLLDRIAKSDRHHRDFTLTSLRRALVEVVAHFPVYRTYWTGSGLSEEDRRYVDWAVAKAKKWQPVADASVYDFIHRVLTGAVAPGPLVESFVRRFQQFTSPVTAKAVEDTAFYIYNRLASLNEVGGEPRTFGMSLKAFHGASLDRAKSWPTTMLATSTHDNKRSEDVRTRIDVLSEAPALWRLALRRWSRLNRRAKTALDGGPAPSRNDEYLLYQTLLGAWPLGRVEGEALEAFRARIEAYMLKAVREAKSRTSWANPDEAYERALSGFIGAILKPGPFLTDFLSAVERVQRFGLLNSLSQTLIKLASPGVPDTYQGTELWDFSLVDPDNRRPVDYELRSGLLKELRGAGTSIAPALAQSMEDGRIKLYVTWKALELRRDHAALSRGDYLPVSAEGGKAEHVCAFARRHERQIVVAVAPRLVVGLCGGEYCLPVGEAVWGDTELCMPAPGRYVDWLTGEALEAGERIPVSRVLSKFPVALLVGANAKRLELASA